MKDFVINISTQSNKKKKKKIQYTVVHFHLSKKHLLLNSDLYPVKPENFTQWYLRMRNSMNNCELA